MRRLFLLASFVLAACNSHTPTKENPPTGVQIERIRKDIPLIMESYRDESKKAVGTQRWNDFASQVVTLVQVYGFTARDLGMSHEEWNTFKNARVENPDTFGEKVILGSASDPHN